MEVTELSVQPDHIHLVCSISPKLAVSDFMGFLKGKPAIKIFKSYPRLKEKPYRICSKPVFLHSFRGFQMKLRPLQKYFKYFMSFQVSHWSIEGTRLLGGLLISLLVLLAPQAAWAQQTSTHANQSPFDSLMTPKAERLIDKAHRAKEQGERDRFHKLRRAFRNEIERQEASHHSRSISDLPSPSSVSPSAPGSGGNYELTNDVASDVVTGGSNDKRAPSMAVDHDNNIYVAYENYESSTTDIGVKWSTDGGKNWYLFSKLSTGYETTLPDIATTKQGRHISMVTGEGNVWVSTVPYDGESYNKVISDGDAVRARIGTDNRLEDQWIYVAWIDKDIGNDDILFSVSNDGGNSFTDPVTIADDAQTNLSLSVSEDNIVYVTYQTESDNVIEVIKSEDYGNSWSSPTQVSTSDNIASRRPSVAGGSNGEAVVTFESKWSFDDNDYEVFESHTTDKGSSWSNPSKISGSDEQEGSDQMLSRVYYEERSGKYQLVYHDDEYVEGDIAQPKVGKIYHISSSAPGGLDTGGPVTSETASPADFPAVAANNLGEEVITWVRDQSSSGSFDILSEGQFSSSSLDPKVTLLKPKGGGGAGYTAGSDLEIAWTSRRTSGTLRISLYRDGNYVQKIKDDVDDFGVYEWKISPKDLKTSDKYQIEVYDVAGTNEFDRSDTFGIKGQVCAGIEVSDGWNLVSVPGRQKDMSVGALFDGITYEVALSYNNSTASYDQVSTLEVGKGYYLWGEEPRTYEVCGFPLGYETSIVKGWNAIGAPGTAVSTSTVTTDPPGQIAVFLTWTQSGGFEVLGSDDKLRPGKGYWVWGSGQATVQLDGGGSASQTARAEEVARPDRMEEWTALDITDEEGRTRTVYLTSEPVEGKRYELPPAAPEKGFDVRFSSGQYVEQFGAEDVRLLLRSVTHPVKISARRLEGQAVRLEAGSGERWTLRGTETATINGGIEQLEISKGEGVPDQFELRPNHPNPFTQSTTLQFALPEAVRVRVEVFNSLGQRVRQVADRRMNAGVHQLTLDASDLASGVYFYRVEAGSVTETGKMTVLK